MEGRLFFLVLNVTRDRHPAEAGHEGLALLREGLDSLSRKLANSGAPSAPGCSEFMLAESLLLNQK